MSSYSLGLRVFLDLKQIDRHIFFPLPHPLDEEDLKQLHRLDYLPFVPAVQTEGEWSFVFASGEFLYSVVKTPARGDFRTQIMHGAKTCHRQPSEKDLSSAQNVLDRVQKMVHLARIDMVRMSSGELVLMELELIEPQLYLHVVKNAANAIAEVTLNHLGKR